MARAVETDLARSYQFKLVDADSGDYLGLSSVTIAPDGGLLGPGKLTICGAFSEALVTFVTTQGPNDLRLSLYSEKHPNDGVDPASVIHVYGVEPTKGTVAPIVWDASESEILKLTATMPYSSLKVSGGGALEQVAAQA